MTLRNHSKKINKLRLSFVLLFVAIPVIEWLVFYVYANFSAFFMAFTNRHGELSFDNFVRFFEEMTMSTSLMREAFRNTFITFAIIVVSYPFKVLVSYFIYKKIPFAGFYRIVFFLPSIIFSVALVLILQQIYGLQGFYAQTIQNLFNLDYTPEVLADSRFANLTILFSMVWMSFPGDLIIWGGAFARIPEELLEAGRIDGVNWWQEFTRIIVPLVWPTVALQMILLCCSVFSASGNVFLMTKGEYGTMTLDSWMYITLLNNSGGAYNSNVYNYLSAVGLILTTVAITISLNVRKFTDKKFEEVEY